jgi:hypothetical protein
MTSPGQKVFFATIILVVVAFLACSPLRYYPAFYDGDGNGINDHYQWGAHSPNPSEIAHLFVDEDGDEVCDLAQDGSPTWHGPGYLPDEDGDGVPEYWDTDSDYYGKNDGMMYIDQSGDGINDYVQVQGHNGHYHHFIDVDGDGICDVAQTGTAKIWHGPNWVDKNGNNICDHWQEEGYAYHY